MYKGLFKVMFFYILFALILAISLSKGLLGKDFSINSVNYLGVFVSVLIETIVIFVLYRLKTAVYTEKHEELFLVYLAIVFGLVHYQISLEYVIGAMLVGYIYLKSFQASRYNFLGLLAPHLIVNFSILTFMI